MQNLTDYSDRRRKIRIVRYKDSRIKFFHKTIMEKMGRKIYIRPFFFCFIHPYSFYWDTPS